MTKSFSQSTGLFSFCLIAALIVPLIQCLPVDNERNSKDRFKREIIPNGAGLQAGPVGNPDTNVLDLLRGYNRGIGGLGGLGGLGGVGGVGNVPDPSTSAGTGIGTTDGGLLDGFNLAKLLNLNQGVSSDASGLVSFLTNSLQNSFGTLGQSLNGVVKSLTDGSQGGLGGQFLGSRGFLG